MKSLLQRLLQQILGYRLYLWIFTRYKLLTLRYDKNENDFFHFLSLLPPDSHTLDIGANLGLMSYHLALKSKHTWAFEPMPNNLMNLEKVKDKYSLSNLSILPYALGSENGQVKLVLPEIEGVKKQGLSHVVHSKMSEFNDGSTIEAKCFKLDDISELEDVKIDAIKIDVENFEYEVFQGAEETLRKHKPIIYCELWDNQNRLDCFDFLKRIGYDISVYVNGELERIQSNPSHIQNFFFIPKE